MIGSNVSAELAQQLEQTLEELRTQGLYKSERVLVTPQGAHVQVAGGAQAINFCANNYQGLATHPRVVEAAQQALHDHGLGVASVRFICGTQDLHKELEESVANFVGTEDAILYSSCFDANGGLFETRLDEKDVVISDALNHASIIDGIRLCKARRLRYAHSDMNELEARLREARDARIRLIATDGVFSMDGDMARLDEIARLAREHGAMVMVDDSAVLREEFHRLSRSSARSRFFHSKKEENPEMLDLLRRSGFPVHAQSDVGTLTVIFDLGNG